jgi:dihydroorotase
MVERDISMAELTGARVHIAHMSARQSLRAVRDGKMRGVPVTTEVTPHHFVLNDEALTQRGGYDTNMKMNPPLREEADRLAMIEGLRDGSIDVIATDHAPHHADEKALEFDRAPFGIVGLETGVSLCLDRLVHAGVIGLPRLVELLSTNPARALGLPGGTLTVGGPADLTILAPDRTVTVRAQSFKSKARNTPFDGWTLKGSVAGTVVNGRLVYADDVALNDAVATH